MTMLSIFQEAVLRQSVAGDVPCNFCHEVMSSAFMDTNHGIIFNGWCIKAMMFHNRSQHNNAAEMDWLQKHGINPHLTRFDKTHWHHDNIANFYDKRFSYRMGVELEAGQELSTLDPQTDTSTIGRGNSTAEDRQ